MISLCASAGTEESPEIRDPPGDALIADRAPSPQGGPADLVDLLAVWFGQKDMLNVSITLHLVDLRWNQGLSEAAAYHSQYAVAFGVHGPDQVDFEASAGFQQGTWDFRLYDHTEEKWNRTSGHVDLENSTIEIDFPQAALKLPASGAHVYPQWAVAWVSMADKGDLQDDAIAPDGTSFTLHRGESPEAQNPPPAGGAPANSGASAAGSRLPGFPWPMVLSALVGTALWRRFLAGPIPPPWADPRSIREISSPDRQKDSE